MTMRELEGHITRTGHERALRKLCITSGLASAEEVATMATLDVCEKIASAYEFVGIREDGNGFLLVAKKDKEQLWKLLKPIDR